MGLAVSYDKSKVKIVQELQPRVNCFLETLPLIVEVQNEQIFLVLVYRKPGKIESFKNNLVFELSCLPKSNRTLVVVDFNMDQMLHGNVEKCEPFLSQFQLYQRCNYSTHNVVWYFGFGIKQQNQWRCILDSLSV